MNIKGIVRGALFAYMIAAAVLFAASAAVYFGMINSKTAGIAVYAAMFFGVFFGALGAARTAGRRLLPNALSVSVVFAAGVIALAAAVHGGFEMTLRTGLILCGAIAAGAAAAIFSA